MNLKTWLESKPFTLSFSSGFFGFFAHTGFAKALDEYGLRAQAHTGASAGAIVAAALSAGLTIKELEDILVNVKLNDFWDPKPGLGLLRGEKMEKLFQSYFGSSFEDLKKPLYLATFNVFKRKTETFASGNLPKAIRASATLPFMFQPVRMGKQFYLDGGILDKMALDSIPKEENILCHYLQGEKAIDLYERKKHERKIGPNTKLITLKKLPRSGPYKLHLGPEIIESAYKQTIDILKTN